VGKSNDVWLNKLGKKDWMRRELGFFSLERLKSKGQDKDAIT
jgi:hypothetical protein